MNYATHSMFQHSLDHPQPPAPAFRTSAVGRRGALRPACAATLGRQRLGGGIGDVNWG